MWLPLPGLDQASEELREDLAAWTAVWEPAAVAIGL